MAVPLDRTIFQPELVAPSGYLAPNATLLGEVYVGEESCVLFGAVLRGIVNRFGSEIKAISKITAAFTPIPDFLARWETE